jgi:hypothetical protein
MAPKHVSITPNTRTVSHAATLAAAAKAAATPAPTAAAVAATKAAAVAAAKARPKIIAVPPGVPVSQNGGAFGFSAGDLPSLGAGELAARLDDMAAMGVGWIRFDMPWNDVAPNGPGAYNWSGYDRTVDAANARHINSLIILDYTPAWARPAGCNAGSKCAPADPAQFAQYAAAAVSHFKSRGVKAWEIWNEPNTSSWSPSPNVAQYTTLLKLTYTAIKGVDASATVLTGGLGPAVTAGNNLAPIDFVKQLYLNGAGGSFDAIGMHPYSYPAPPSLNESWSGWMQMLDIRNTMVQNGDQIKKIWMTEYGAPTNGPGAGATPGNYNFSGSPDHVDEALQAIMAQQAVSLSRGYSWAGPLLWYGYKDLGTNQSDNENFFGLVRADGSHKAAYSAFANAIKP